MKNTYKPFNRFFLRTPLFPYACLQEEDVYNQSEAFQEGILLGSPDLYESRTEKRNKEKEERKAISLHKYFARSCTRCTPFGTFAGCSVGTPGEKTEIELQPAEQYQKKTRLDMQYLCSLIQYIETRPEISKQLLYYPNDTLYQMGDSLRYLEYYYQKNKRVHKVSSVEISPYLLNVLENAQKGQTLQLLAQSLVSDEIDYEDAFEFVESLVHEQLLQSELEPSVVGGDMLDNLIRKLSRLESPDILSSLKLLQQTLVELDTLPLGKGKDKYNHIREIVGSLKVPFEKKYLLQTDLFKPIKTATVSNGVIEDLQDVIGFLSSFVSEQRNTNLENFKKAFSERYEEAEVPLALVLDNETGLGYPVSTATNDVNILIDDLVLPAQGGTGARNYTVSNIDVLLLKKYIEAQKENLQEIEISGNDFKGGKPSLFFDTCTTMVSLLADNGEERRIFLKSGVSSGSINLLGRFCHLDPQIDEWVREIAEKESSFHPDVILAEIAHLPESRIGNILSRPLFRDYVLKYMSNAGTDRERQIQIDDLFVSVRNGRVVLRSRRLNKEIIPRLSSAHNYSMGTIPAYRFFCDLQFQQPVKSLHFGWGELFGVFDYLPRVRYKNVILARQRWVIKKEEIKELPDKDDTALLQAVSWLRNKRQLPRYIIYAESDNEMTIDLENSRSIRCWLSLVKKRTSFFVEESLFDEEQAVVKEKGKGFTNEMIFVFHR